MDDKILETLTNIIKDDVSGPIKALGQKMDANFETAFSRLQSIEQEQTAFGVQLDRVEARLINLETTVKKMDKHLTTVETTVVKIDSRLSGVEKKVA